MACVTPTHQDYSSSSSLCFFLFLFFSYLNLGNLYVKMSNYTAAEIVYWQVSPSFSVTTFSFFFIMPFTTCYLFCLFLSFCCTQVCYFRVRSVFYVPPEFSLTFAFLSRTISFLPAAERERETKNR